MIEYYKKPTVKFIVNKGNFNKLMGILTFQEEKLYNSRVERKCNKIKRIIIKIFFTTKRRRRRNINYRYCIIQKEAAEMIVLLLSALDRVQIDEDYTKLMKRQ